MNKLMDLKHSTCKKMKTMKKLLIHNFQMDYWSQPQEFDLLSPYEFFSKICKKTKPILL